MTDGDHYAEYKSVQELLSNAELGVADATLYNDTSMERALDITMAVIHNYLGLKTMTKVGDPVDLIVMEGIQVNLVNMQILRARNMKENNIGDFGTTIQFWSITPYLTREDKTQLDRIQRKLFSGVKNYDIRTGREVC